MVSFEAYPCIRCGAPIACPPGAFVDCGHCGAQMQAPSGGGRPASRFACPGCGATLQGWPGSVQRCVYCERDVPIPGGGPVFAGVVQMHVASGSSPLEEAMKRLGRPAAVAPAPAPGPAPAPAADGVPRWVVIAVFVALAGVLVGSAIWVAAMIASR